jgi:hypothetical protein
MNLNAVRGIAQQRWTPSHRLMSSVVALAVVCGVWLTTVGAATAAPRSLNGFIGGAAGQSTGGLITQPRDVAVYSGNTPTRSDDRIVVVESLSNNSRVQVLDGDGNFMLLWGRDVAQADSSDNLGDGFEVCRAVGGGADSCKAGRVGTLGGELSNPTGVTIDQATGHVYVMDRGNRRVQEFDLDGTFIRAWGWDVVQTGGIGDDATPPAGEFEICTVATQCQAGSDGEGAGQFATSDVNSIDIDPAAPHHLFVTDSANRRVLEFEPDGSFVQGWGFDVSTGGGAAFETCTAADCRAGQATGGPNDGQFATGWPQHVAVDSAGVVYASDSTDGNRVVRFDTDPAPVLLEPLPSTLLADGQTAGLEIDAGGNLLVTRDRTTGITLAVLQEIANPGADLPPGGPPNPTSTDINTIADETDNAVGERVWNTGLDPATGNVYVTAPTLWTPSFGGVFTGCSAPPGVPCSGLLVMDETVGGLDASMEAPTDVDATSALLTGSINVGGGNATYSFQISADGQNWTDVGGSRNVAGDGATQVSLEAEGLEPATLYRVRLNVSKQTDIATTESAVSNEDVFLTDAAEPAVQTLGSTDRTESAARLRARVDPNGSSTTYRFEYGPAGGAFDNHIPVPDGQAGAGNSAQLFTQMVSGLQPDTAYHYRIVATNFVGTAIGEPVTFKTKPQQEVDPPAGRGYELVSPTEKISGVGAGVWYNGPSASGSAGVAAHEGERFAVRGTFGSVLTGGNFEYVSNWTMTERTPQGWLHSPAMTRRAHAPQVVTDVGIVASTPTLSLTGWGSNGHWLKLFEEMADWPEEGQEALLLRDWPGKWEVFGPTHPDQRGGLQATAVIADDGNAVAGSGLIRGLTGSSDPTLDLPEPAAKSVYIDELAPSGLSDTFPGAGARHPVNVCAGGTEIPERTDTGGGVFKQGAQTCRERQTVTVSATGGTFTLTFDGQTTAPIPFDAPASGAGSVQAALESLSNLAPGDISVSGGPGNPGGTTPYVVHFASDLGDVPEMTSDATQLTGGASSAVVATTDTLIDLRGAVLGEDRDGVINADGSRVFFLSPDPAVDATACQGAGQATTCPAQLYVRQRNGDGNVVTRWISRSEVPGQDASLMGEAIFEGASADGDKVFFRSAAPLTADDRNGSIGSPPPGGVVTGGPVQTSWDLYMYDLPDAPGADPADGDLTRISAGPDGSGDCNSPLGGSTNVGALRFVSDDGNRLLFTCSAPLDGVPLADDGTITSPDGTPTTSSHTNLYAYDANQPVEQRWRFVARLPRDSTFGTCATTGVQEGMPLKPKSAPDPNLSIFDEVNCVHGTPDGGMVVFWTDGQLTDDDPDDVSADLYAYDVEQDELARASAPQGGVGGAYECALGISSAPCYGDGGIGGSSSALPKLGVATDPDNGLRSVFFQSRSRLIPADTDTAYDVYQWNADDGLALISANVDEDAFFMGNDHDGINVYFATRQRLTWQDKDAVLDIYTARVDGGIPEPPPTNETCDPTADQCQAPTGPAPPSQTDSDQPSVGNTPATRLRITVRRPTSAARRKAIRTRRLAIRINTSAPVTATLRIQAKPRGRKPAAIRARRGLVVGDNVVVVRISKAVRRRLASKRAVSLTIRVTAPGSRPVVTAATFR